MAYRIIKSCYKFKNIVKYAHANVLLFIILLRKSFTTTLKYTFKIELSILFHKKI